MLCISLEDVFSKSTKGFISPKRNLSLMNSSAFGVNEHWPAAVRTAFSQVEKKMFGLPVPFVSESGIDLSYTRVFAPT